MFDREELKKLDRLRRDDPEKINRRLEKYIAVVPMELMAELLMTYGSTFRQLDRLPDARWAFYAGEISAQKAENRLILATIFQKRSWVEFADGNFDEALWLLRQASGTFLEVGADNNSARVLVDTATQYVERGRFSEAVSCAESALHKLKGAENWNRFTSYQVLAWGYKNLGDGTAALENLELAGTLLIHCPKDAAVRFTWLAAKIKSDLLPLADVAPVFEAAATFFLESGEVLNGSQALLEYARCLLALDWQADLQRLAPLLKSASFQVDSGVPLGRLSAAVLLKVAQAIDRGTATESLVKAAIQRIQEAGAAKAPAYTKI
jgi:tetratricopeptide (TPR) repeat protein